MRFVLLVTTLGRSAEMSRLLESLSLQTCRSLTVYIGDQSNGALSGLWKKYGGNLDLRILPLERKGVSFARNTLLDRCAKQTYDIIAFPDDDCWYPPDALEKVGNWFGAHPGVGGIVANWRGGPEYTAPPLLPKRLSMLTAFQRAETYVQFYRREAVEAIGKWDEKLGPGTSLPYGSGEDTDFLLRALKKNIRLVRANAIEIFHPEICLDSANISRWRSYGHGRMYVIRKHRLPGWFRLANVVYPLWRMLREPPRYWGYRWHMFRGRLQGLLLAARPEAPKGGQPVSTKI